MCEVSNLCCASMFVVSKFHVQLLCVKLRSVKSSKRLSSKKVLSVKTRSCKALSFKVLTVKVLRCIVLTFKVLSCKVRSCHIRVRLLDVLDLLHHLRSEKAAASTISSRILHECIYRAFLECGGSGAPTGFPRRPYWLSFNFSTLRLQFAACLQTYKKNLQGSRGALHKCSFAVVLLCTRVALH